MGMSFAVKMRRAGIPTSSEIASVAQRVEQGFRFSEPFDPRTDRGWCPCSIRGQDCGFEWDLETDSDSVADEVLATLTFRSSNLDRICALLSAGAIAMAGQGRFLDVEGTELPSDQALDWAAAELSTLPKNESTKKRKAKGSPKAALTAWLRTLAGQSVDGIVRMAAPDLGLSFQVGGGRVVIQRWEWIQRGQGYSTQTLPREVPAAEVANLAKGTEGLAKLLQCGPIASAELTEHLSLLFHIEDGMFEVFAQGSGYPTETERLRAGISDPWEVIVGTASYAPDIENGSIRTR